MSPRRLARSAGLIGTATLASRLLGLVREVVQGAYFATSNAADAFGVATRIPSLLRDLFAEGAMSAAFVPTLSRIHQTEGREAAWRLGSQVINALIVVTGAFVIVGTVFVRPLVETYAPGFEEQLGKTSLTISLTRINMPFLMLVAVAAACMGMLNSLRRFMIPASSPALFNVVFILCTVILVPVFTRTGIEPIMALSVAMLLGGVIQIAVQWPALRREGYRHQWILDPSDPALRSVLVLMGPGTLGVAAAQINLLINTSLATVRTGRRVGARVRVSTDVHADRHLRRVGRDGGHPRSRPAGGDACLRGNARDALVRRPADADAERAGQRWLDGARGPHRGVDLPARRLRAVGHRRRSRPLFFSMPRRSRATQSSKLRARVSIPCRTRARRSS